jgi:hypothetical protein
VKARPDDTPDLPEHHVDPALIRDEVSDRVKLGQMLGCRSAPELTEKLTGIRTGHHPIKDPD